MTLLTQRTLMRTLTYLRSNCRVTMGFKLLPLLKLENNMMLQYSEMYTSRNHDSSGASRPARSKTKPNMAPNTIEHNQDKPNSTQDNPSPPPDPLCVRKVMRDWMEGVVLFLRRPGTGEIEATVWLCLASWYALPRPCSDCPATLLPSFGPGPRQPLDTPLRPDSHGRKRFRRSHQCSASWEEITQQLVDNAPALEVSHRTITRTFRLSQQ